MAMTEIEVFGGGIFGLSVAYACLKRGARVRVIEKRKIGAGASGGMVGALAPHTPDSWNDKKQFQYQSLIATERFWAEVDAISGLSSGYGRNGRLCAIADQRTLSLAYERIDQAAERWQGIAEWAVLPVDPSNIWHPASPTGYLSFDTLSARMSPRGACKSLARAFEKQGGEILEGVSRGKGADAVVLSTGYEGLLSLGQELGEKAGKGVKGQSVLVKHDAGDLPQLFADGVHIVPHADGTVAIGSTSEIEWEDAQSVDTQLDAVLARAKAICPILENAPELGRWAGVRPRSPRRTPMLGAHPTQKNVFIANGGFKIGFGVVVRSAEVMADLILNGQADIPQSFTVEANLGGKN